MRKSILTVLIIGLFAGLWVAAQSWSSRLEVSRITVRGLNYIEPDEIKRLADIPESILLREVDLEEIGIRVRRHPYVKRARVNRDFPSSIRITVEERRPAALLVGSRMSVLDEEKIVMPVRHGEVLRNLMIISGTFAIPEAGDTLKHKGVSEAMRIARAAAAADNMLYQLFSEIRILGDGSLLAYTADGGVPVMLGTGVSAGKLISFKEFWLQEAVPAGADQIQSIDLRFEGQVVTRWRAGGAGR